MPIERYRSALDMPPPPPRDPRDPSTWVAIRELWSLALKTLPPLYPPGVTRFRSIEEAQHARDEATVERMRAVRRQRTARRALEGGDEAAGDPEPTIAGETAGRK